MRAVAKGGMGSSFLSISVEWRRRPLLGQRGCSEHETIAIFAYDALQVQGAAGDDRAVAVVPADAVEGVAQCGAPAGLALVEQRALLGDVAREVRERHADRVQ